MSFKVPGDSLSKRYGESYRVHTWEGVVGPSGVEVLPSIREQTGPTCLYEAICVWMEAYLRLNGITSKLSAKDLEEKEQSLMTEETDRTLRCIDVVKHIGICSEDDYNSQNPYATVYTFKRTEFFFSLHEPHFRKAVEKMDHGPLLVVFHVGQNYNDYVTKFQQKPVLSYEQYDEGRMRSHGSCAIAYGIESLVPFWKIMNSHGEKNATKGFGRVLPQNVIYLVAPIGLQIHKLKATAAPLAAPEAPAPLEATAAPEAPAPLEATAAPLAAPEAPVPLPAAAPEAPTAPAAPAPSARKRSSSTDASSKAQFSAPPRKKRKVGHLL